MSAQKAIKKLLNSIIKLMPRSTGQNWDMLEIVHLLQIIPENPEYCTMCWTYINRVKVPQKCESVEFEDTEEIT